LIDVGGQRNERKKWAKIFEQANMLVYIAALSDYNKKCYEDDSSNRLEESLQVFDDVINNNFFKNSTIVLLLNKYDVFSEKIKSVPLSEFFPDFKDGGDVEKAYNFIVGMYKDKDKSIDSREIIVARMVATEKTDSIKETLKYVLGKIDEIKK